ncbi:hypothetical protein [Leptospira levettii]|uniref:hypothetical protein n=1 Tax=Leptospira levettii TaxID=2023178 RepID=UPI00108278FE|nr:hypothetical protein [Leptospira levettii]TGK92803.1 hypothetical protein EHQ34_17840 [Leptospira levettii]
MRKLLIIVITLLMLSCNENYEGRFYTQNLNLSKLSFRCRVEYSSTGSINSEKANQNKGKMKIENSKENIEFIFSSDSNKYFVTYSNQKNAVTIFGIENSIEGKRITLYEELRGVNDSKQNGKMQYYIITSEGKFIWMKYSAYVGTDESVFGLGKCDTIY